MILFIIGTILIAVSTIAFVFINLRIKSTFKKEKEVSIKANKIIKNAKRKAEDFLREAKIQSKEDALKIKNELEKESKERHKELIEIEKKLLKKEDHVDSKERTIEKREVEIYEKQQYITKQKRKLDEIYGKQVEILEKITSLGKKEAKEMLLNNLEREVRNDAAKFIKEAEEMANKIAIKKSREIIATAIQRCAVDNVVEISTSIVQLPGDDMKGRIIGREGRNIRAFETLTGIDLIVDDTPETVVLSGFDPIRREIAKLTLQKLVYDGRIHPTRIEEIYKQSKKNLEETIMEIGESTALKVDVQNLSPKIIYLIGRLNYRTSYGQNILQHSIEVAHISSMIAQELGVNTRLARRAGFLHDLGKAIDFEKEGTHAQLGAEFASKNGENDEVVHAILAHHEEVKPQTIEALLVAAADAISASRPGARRESIEAYVKRLEKLENLATNFEGVEKAFAIQSGREIRIMVKPEIINDKMSAKLARDIVKKIENELEYPGTILVTIIRETRFQDTAK